MGARRRGGKAAKGPFSPAARQEPVSACYQAGASSAKPAGALRSSSKVTIS